MTITLQDLSKSWLESSREYRPSTFWFWNADMSLELMRDAAVQMAAADIREVVFHPIHGMEIEYLSDEYFDRLRYGLQLAVELGFKVWIYDEYGWPSGNAGGLLLREHPEHRGWILECCRDAQGNAIATPLQSDMVLDNVVGAPWTRGEEGYLDTLSPEAVRCFIDLTYERVYQECGPLFQKAVVGFFTDEPTTMVPRFRDDHPGPWDAIGLPWTPRLPELFLERFGYDVASKYQELIANHSGQIKRDYWVLVKELYSEAYYGQIGRWCREHEVKFTGHAGEDTLLMQSRFSGSLYECLRHMDEPGIDYLGAGPEPDDRFLEMVTVNSIARHAGKNRVFCEAFGVSYPDVGPGKLVRRAQMLALHGVDDIAVMGFHQDLSGIRKHTYWPQFFVQSAWWSYYPTFRDAIARSLGLTSLGAASVRYALLYPQDELEQVGVFHSVFGGDDASTKSLNEIAQAVYAAGETFDFIFPEIVDQAITAHGKIVMPHGNYEALLVPSELSVLPEVQRHIEKLWENGGKVHYLTTDRIAALLSSTGPSWSDRLWVNQDGKAGDIRIFRFRFPDGDLFALRNVTENEIIISVSADLLELTEWDPTAGSLLCCQRRFDGAIAGHSTRYFTLTEHVLTRESSEFSRQAVPIAAEWRLDTSAGCVARPINMRFFHPEGGWTDAQSTSIFPTDRRNSENGVPQSFAGRRRIEMEAEFVYDPEQTEVSTPIGIIFEAGHLVKLAVNDIAVDLAQSRSVSGWSASCRQIDIQDCVRSGANVIAGTISYEAFETSLTSQAFFWYRPMPSADVFLWQANPPSSDWLPLDGTLRYRALIEVSREDASIASGMMVDLIAEDAIEVLLDGQSLGKRITAPYRFDIDRLDEGVHEIEIRLSSPGATLFGGPAAHGLKAVSWTVSQSSRRYAEAIYS